MIILASIIKFIAAVILTFLLFSALALSGVIYEYYKKMDRVKK
jgi:hypothetical protein